MKRQQPEQPTTLQQAIVYFSDYENCHRFMVELRWPDGKIKCPRCGSGDVKWLPNAKVFKCYQKHDRQKFSLKVGTIFEDSPIPLEKWLVAVWLAVNCKNGISSYEVHRDLGITQKSTWFMMHRIRKALQSGSLGKLGGRVEVDETFIGGKARFMHKSKRAKVAKRGASGKAIVVGILERGGKVRAQMVENREREAVQGIVRENVQPGSDLYTDEWSAYFGLAPEYAHQVINHADSYVEGQVHTNGLENFWSLLKRGLKGTYVSVEPFHLFRYLDEQMFRFNNRATKDNPMKDADRFTLAMSQIVGKRLTYQELIGRGSSAEA